jgi:hypothetical protein
MNTNIDITNELNYLTTKFNCSLKIAVTRGVQEAYIAKGMAKSRAFHAAYEMFKAMQESPNQDTVFFKCFIEDFKAGEPIYIGLKATIDNDTITITLPSEA